MRHSACLLWPGAARPGHAGPPAGFLTGLARCDTRFLVVVPCDAPPFPAHLVERMALALASRHADPALPVTCEHGERRAHILLRGHARAFANANTLAELNDLERHD